LHGKTHQVMPRLNTGSWQTSFRNLPDFHLYDDIPAIDKHSGS
jgi:hypothetical protein